jgi:hypothetical protein
MQLNEFDTGNKLIEDILKTWGNNFQSLPYCDRYYMIYICSEFIRLHWIKEDVSKAADKISARILAGELPITQVQKLIQGLSHNWGHNLPVMSECDKYDMLTNFSWHIYLECDERSSDDADEIAGRLHELSFEQLKALITVLVDGM